MTDSAPPAGPRSEGGRPSAEPPARLSDAEPILVTEGKAPEDPADRWLVQLRWVAILGMSATVLVADRWVEGLRLRELFAMLGVIAAVNVGWMVLVRRSGAGRSWVVPQIVGDVLCLAVVLWLAGGLENPFAAFLAFQIALAGLLCTPKETLSVGAVTIAAIFVLTQAAPLPVVGRTPEVVARAASVVSLCGFVAVFVSVYAQRLARLRRESARNERLATLGRLVGSMSHELNTPLNTILLASRDLADFGAETSGEDARMLARSIAEEARRAHEIIGLVRGHLNPERPREEVELCAFVEEIAREELDRLEFRGERRMSMTPPVRASVVKAALVQVLVNLLTNAAEASAPRAKRRIEVSVRATEDGAAEVSVEDRGPGFAPEILARLGEPFSTTKLGDKERDDAGGMGLGLYVSARLCRHMGATLRVQSVIGGGARVTVSIPGARTDASG